MYRNLYHHSEYVLFNCRSAVKPVTCQLMPMSSFHPLLVKNIKEEMFPTEEEPKPTRWTSILIEICMLYCNKNQQYSYHHYHWIVIIRANRRNFNRTGLEEKQGLFPPLLCFLIKLKTVLTVSSSQVWCFRTHTFFLFISFPLQKWNTVKIILINP